MTVVSNVFVLVERDEVDRLLDQQFSGKTRLTGRGTLHAHPEILATIEAQLEQILSPGLTPSGCSQERSSSLRILNQCRLLENSLNSKCYTFSRLLALQIDKRTHSHSVVELQRRHAEGAVKWLQSSNREWERFILRRIFCAWRTQAKKEAAENSAFAEMHSKVAHAQQLVEEKSKLAKQAQLRLTEILVAVDKERHEVAREREQERDELHSLRRKVREQTEDIERLNQKIIDLEAKRVFLSSELERREVKLKQFFHQTRQLADVGQVAASRSVGGPIALKGTSASNFDSSLVAPSPTGKGQQGFLLHFNDPEPVVYDVDFDADTLLEGVSELLEEAMSCIAPISSDAFVFTDILNSLSNQPGDAHASLPTPAIASPTRPIEMTIDNFTELLVFLTERQRERLDGLQLWREQFKELRDALSKAPVSRFVVSPQPPLSGQHPMEVLTPTVPNLEHPSGVTDEANGKQQVNTFRRPTRSGPSRTAGEKPTAFLSRGKPLDSLPLLGVTAPVLEKRRLYSEQQIAADQLQRRIIEAIMKESTKGQLPRWLKMLACVLIGESDICNAVRVAESLGFAPVAIDQPQPDSMDEQSMEAQQRRATPSGQGDPVITNEVKTSHRRVSPSISQSQSAHDPSEGLVAELSTSASDADEECLNLDEVYDDDEKRRLRTEFVKRNVIRRLSRGTGLLKQQVKAVMAAVRPKSAIGSEPPLDEGSRVLSISTPQPPPTPVPPVPAAQGAIRKKSLRNSKRAGSAENVEPMHRAHDSSIVDRDVDPVALLSTGNAQRLVNMYLETAKEFVIFRDTATPANKKGTSKGKGAPLGETGEEAEVDVPSFCVAREEPPRLADLRKRVREAWLRGRALQSLQSRVGYEILVETAKSLIGEQRLMYERMMQSMHEEQLWLQQQLQAKEQRSTGGVSLSGAVSSASFARRKSTTVK